MTVTVLDPTTALIVIDLQKGLVGIEAAHPMPDVIARSATLAKAFRQHELPVVLVTADGGAPGRTETTSAGRTFPPDFADLVPELDHQPGDVLVTKQRWGAFQGTKLHDELQARGVTQVVITGVATSAGVESTARSAHEHGYHVVLVTDAMTDRSIEAHRNSTERIFPKIGETGTTDDVVALLEGRRGAVER